jgi:iron(III) transport system ATP-binding protein
MSYLKLTHIEKKGLSSNFKLNDITFSVEKGQILALVGESGSGKTTLLRIISGLDTPDSGFITLDEQPIFDAQNFVAAEDRNIAYVFQDYALFPHLTVENNIRFGIDNLPAAEQKKRVSEMLELVNLTDFAGRYPNELSGGEQQRVAVARALAIQPKVLLLDEPFSNLDFIRRENLKTELKSILKKANTTAVFVTHDTTEALYLADKIIVMKEGKILQQGSPEKIYNFPVNQYVAAFFGKANFFETMISDENYLLPFDINLRKLDTKRYDRVGVTIRPNGFFIKEGAKMQGVIEEKYFLGTVIEFRIKVVFQERIYNFIVHTQPDSLYTVGQTIAFDAYPEAVHFLLGEATTWD